VRLHGVVEAGKREIGNRKGRSTDERGEWFGGAHCQIHEESLEFLWFGLPLHEIQIFEYEFFAVLLADSIFEVVEVEHSTQLLERFRVVVVNLVLNNDHWPRALVITA